MIFDTLTYSIAAVVITLTYVVYRLTRSSNKHK